jgi:hypothetical protein
MQNLIHKQTDFYQSWGVQRKYKWRYIFLHGSVLWGISVALAIILGEKIFSSESRTLYSAVIMISFFMVGGLFVGNKQFKQKEMIYDGLVANDNEIGKGATILENEKNWSHENLIFTLTDHQTVIVRNKLFWLSNNQPTPGEADDCLFTMLEDVTRLRKNKILGSFLESKKIILQLFNNEDSVNPIAEKCI